MIILWEKVDLYCLNLSNFIKNDHHNIPENYSFKIVDSVDETFDKLKKHYFNRGKNYLKLAYQRLSSGNYTCYTYINNTNGEIAYTRWVCYKQFYSNRYKKQFTFEHNEAITLDSYTHPSYRKQGLHKSMNSMMINHLIKENKIDKLYMIIIRGNNHLNKVVEELGYKRIKTRINFRFKEIIQAIINKYTRG